MGTPHRGADLAVSATLATRLATFVGKAGNDKVISSLQSGSPILEDLQSTFAGYQMRFNICTALEVRGMHGVGKVRPKCSDEQRYIRPVRTDMLQIVEENHATLDFEREEVIHIQADHRDMCKYSSKKDNGYRKLALAISDQVCEAQAI